MVTGLKKTSFSPALSIDISISIIVFIFRLIPLSIQSELLKIKSHNQISHLQAKNLYGCQSNFGWQKFKQLNLDSKGNIKISCVTFFADNMNG